MSNNKEHQDLCESIWKTKYCVCLLGTLLLRAENVDNDAIARYLCSINDDVNNVLKQLKSVVDGDIIQSAAIKAKVSVEKLKTNSPSATDSLSKPPIREIDLVLKTSSTSAEADSNDEKRLQTAHKTIGGAKQQTLEATLPASASINKLQAGMQQTAATSTTQSTANPCTADSVLDLSLTSVDADSNERRLQTAVTSSELSQKNLNDNTNGGVKQQTVEATLPSFASTNNLQTEEIQQIAATSTTQSTDFNFEQFVVDCFTKNTSVYMSFDPDDTDGTLVLKGFDSITTTAIAVARSFESDRDLKELANVIRSVFKLNGIRMDVVRLQNAIKKDQIDAEYPLANVDESLGHFLNKLDKKSSPSSYESMDEIQSAIAAYFSDEMGKERPTKEMRQNCMTIRQPMKNCFQVLAYLAFAERLTRIVTIEELKQKLSNPNYTEFETLLDQLLPHKGTTEYDKAREDLEKLTVCEFIQTHVKSWLCEPNSKKNAIRAIELTIGQLSSTKWKHKHTVAESVPVTIDLSCLTEEEIKRYESVDPSTKLFFCNNRKRPPTAARIYQTCLVSELFSSLVVSNDSRLLLRVGLLLLPPSHFTEKPKDLGELSLWEFCKDTVLRNNPYKLQVRKNVEYILGKARKGLTEKIAKDCIFFRNTSSCKKIIEEHINLAMTDCIDLDGELSSEEDSSVTE